GGGGGGWGGRAGGGPGGTARELEAFVELAAEWESPVVRVFGGEISGGDDSAAMDSMADVLDLVAPAAERAGVGIAVETHDAWSSARAVAALLDLVPSPAVGALWDVLHTARV